MKRKRKIALALFLAFAMILQYSVIPQGNMAFAEEADAAGESAAASDQAPAKASDSGSSSSSSASSSSTSSSSSSSSSSASSSSSSSSSSASSGSSSSSSGASSASSAPASSSSSSNSSSGNSSSSSSDSASSAEASAQPSDSQSEGKTAEAEPAGNSSGESSGESADVKDEKASSSEKSNAEKSGTEKSSTEQSSATSATTEDQNNTETAKEPAEQTTVKPQTTSLKSTSASTALKANANDTSWQVHVTNILYTVKKAVDGHAVAYDETQTKASKSTQSFFNSKGTPIAGPLSWAGGSNRTAGGIGYNYTFQNKYVLSEEGDGPVITDNVADVVYITKIQYNGGNDMIVTLSDGTTKSIDSNEVYISPVYTAKAYWYLNYNYIDNISTGSGSWSNKDGIVEFKHTFRNPEDKSPGLTKDYYKFVRWQNDETGETYLDSDDPDSISEFNYNGVGMKDGETKDVNIYAYWQPAVIVNYMVEQVKDATARSLEEGIDVYDSYPDEAALSDEDYAFAGWFDENDSRVEEGVIYELPGVTKEANSYKEHNVTAKWQPAVSLIYNVLGNAVEQVKNTLGESIRVYDKTAESTVDGVTFEGWYDSEGNRLSEDMSYAAPEITDRKGTAATYNVFARFITSRSVQKIWDDAGNKDRIRSNSVSVQLYANGEPTGKTIQLSSANSWKAVFADLEAYDKEGNLIEYSISEESIPDGYTAKIDVDGTAFTLTNSHTPKPAPSPDPEDDPGNGPTPGPTGGDDPAGGTPGTGTGNGGTAGTILTGGAAPLTIVGANVPAAPAATPDAATIEDTNPPLATSAYWALINLLCAIATVLLSIIMLIRYFGKRKEEDEETGEETEIKRKGGVRLASVIPAIGAVIAFILTEDMTNPMIMIDKWTILMVVILAVQICVAIVAKTKKKTDDENGEEANAYA